MIAEAPVVDNEAYVQFATSLHLATVQCVVFRGERLEPGQSLSTRFDVTAGVLVKPPEYLYRFDATAQLMSTPDPHDEEAVQVGVVECSVVAVFRRDDEGEPPEQYLARFGQTSALLVGYPYVREHITGLATRLGYAGVTLPLVFTSDETITGVDGAEVEAR
jgi:hypothetical protein